MKAVSRGKLVISLFMVIVIALAGAIGVYYLMLPNEGVDAIPSSTHLKNGDYVKYVEKSYVDNTQVSEYPITWNVSEGVFNGTDCFVIKVTANVDANTTTLIYWYMDKSTYECLSMKTQTFVNNVLSSEYESEYSSPPAVVDPKTIVGKETITVPAGTLTCYKAVVTDEATGKVTSLWFNADVPIVGLVKFETYENYQLITERELIDYSK